MMEQHTQASTLMQHVPTTWRAGGPAHALSRCVRGGKDARAMLRVAYAHARGWLCHESISAAEWEAIYAALWRWGDADALREIITRIDGIRQQMDAALKPGGLRNMDGIKAMLDVSQSSVVVTYMTAAIYRAVKRRLAELEPAEAA